MEALRDYRSPFVLDESKLHRIHSVIQSQFSPLGRDHFTQYIARLKSGKTITVADLNQLLSIDNSIKNSVRSLNIITKTKGGPPPSGEEKKQLDEPESKDYYCELEFTDFSWATISLRARSSEPTWTHTTSAALEEQIERTLVSFRQA